MKYRKWGRMTRYENGTIVRVEEAGEAIDEGGEFRAAPLLERRGLGEVADPHPPFGHLLPLRREKGADTPGEGVEIERIVLTEGFAIHEFGAVTWSERARRMHLSIVRPPYRMLIDQADFDLDPALIALFARIDGRREPPPRLTLVPRVSAAILPSLIGRIDLAQRAGETPDGKGQPVASCPVTAGEPPNWYRPSYRVRPARAWFNLLALPFGRLDDRAPRAVARLGGGDVLCVDGDDVFATPLTIGRVLAGGGAAEWYPFGAGAWGADILVECGRPGRTDRASRPIA